MGFGSSPAKKAPRPFLNSGFLRMQATFFPKLLFERKEKGGNRLRENSATRWDDEPFMASMKY